MKKALLVMDMQEVTVGDNHAAMFRYPTDLLRRVNAVIEQNRDSLIVYVRNLMKDNPLNRLAPVRVFPGTAEAELASGLCVLSPHVIDKYRGDAFSNPRLPELLQREGVWEVELMGVDGGGCVALTAMGACKAGFAVALNTGAIGTVFPEKRDRYYEKLKKQGARIL